MSKHVLWTLPRSAKNLEVEFTERGGDCVIRLRDPFDHSSTMELQFLGVAAYTFTGDPLCTLEHIEAYDKVVELAGAGWGAGCGERSRHDQSRRAASLSGVPGRARRVRLLAEAFHPGDARPSFGS